MSRFLAIRMLAWAGPVAACLTACAEPRAEEGGRAAAPAEKTPWLELFDGSGLGSWESIEYGGEGVVRVDEEGHLVLPMGSPLTGVRWTATPPRVPYELVVEATRRLGTDFFCGLTFPVGEESLTLVLGGWGGSLCGISSLDHMDASSNETTRFIEFTAGTFVEARLRVEADRLRVKLDGELLYDVALEGRHLSLRPEVDPSAPFGISAFSTEAAVRRIAFRAIPSSLEDTLPF